MDALEEAVSFASNAMANLGSTPNLPDVNPMTVASPSDELATRARAAALTLELKKLTLPISKNLLRSINQTWLAGKSPN